MIKDLFDNIGLKLSVFVLVLKGFVSGVYGNCIQVEYCYIDDELC